MNQYTSMRIEDYDCQFCGKKATQFVFAAFVCKNDECVEKARVERGGPGGHMKKKDKGIIDIDE